MEVLRSRLYEMEAQRRRDETARDPQEPSRHRRTGAGSPTLADTSENGALARTIEADVSARDETTAEQDAVYWRTLHAEACAAGHGLPPWVGEASGFSSRVHQHQ